MSVCISQKGEFGSHSTTEGNYICDDCGVLDEDGIFAELERLREVEAAVSVVRAERDAEVERWKHHAWEAGEARGQRLCVHGQTRATCGTCDTIREARDRGR